MTTEHYQLTKVVEASKDWRHTDKQKIGASKGGVPPEVKAAAISKHRHSEQKLREAVDKLAQKVGAQP